MRCHGIIKSVDDVPVIAAIVQRLVVVFFIPHGRSEAVA
jgi:hypothetical protein